MGLQEVILCATAPQPSDSGPAQASGPGAFVLHDLQTSNVLSSFKQTNSAPHCSAFVETKDGQGGIMVAAQSDKTLLNVYNFQKDQIALKVVLPEKLTCLALDQKAKYCAGGTAQGRIYLWEVVSGILYHSWDAHYRQVNVLTFTYDGAILMSASEDSGVGVWSVSKLVDDDLQNNHPLPQFTLSDHTLPVVDIVCGLGPFPMCRILTGSLDHTVKLWDLGTQSLITTFHFPKPIRCIVWDITERLFFASSPDGSIYQVNLFREREVKNNAGPFIEAVGGAGASDVIRFDVDGTAGQKRLIDVGQPVTALCISLNGSLLLVGTASGLIHVYDISSHQLLRTISTHKGLSISFLATMLKPPDLVGHISLSLNVASTADARDVMPVRPVASFHRMKDMNARELHEVSMMLPITSETPQIGRCEYDYSESEFQKDLFSFVQPTEAEPLGAPLTNRVAELEAEVEQLKEQLGKAKGVNDAIWQVVVQKALKGNPALEGDDSMDG
ncbi:WD40-repeat-containing domain protein [Boletus edulis BED1]|uniref:Pre-rRNA-processing protein IPI3 n=1 Tax=Boletus edulis BED1 TaxID=1328754 RepID=A0AAD4C5U9_BOLED|nr:WD40-repeat-containing domain protein [Boletus edulis BED1]